MALDGFVRQIKQTAKNLKMIVKTARKENVLLILLLQSVGFKLFSEKIDNYNSFEYFLQK